MFHVYRKGVAAMYEEFTIPGQWQLEEIRLHLDANGGNAEDYTITVQSSEGSEYDLLLNTAAMNADADVQYKPTRPDPMAPGDAVLMEWTNAAGQGWGLEIIYSLT